MMEDEREHNVTFSEVLSVIYQSVHVTSENFPPVDSLALTSNHSDSEAEVLER